MANWVVFWGCLVNMLTELFRRSVNWGCVAAFFLFGVALYAEVATPAHMDSLSACRYDYMENELHPWIIANGWWFPPSLAGELFSLLVVLCCSWGEAKEAVLCMGFGWLELGQ